jgi:hypothetical protein
MRMQQEALTTERAATRRFAQLPYNPDDPMRQCGVCDDWFHPRCLGRRTEEVMRDRSFTCDGCASSKVPKAAPTD